MLGGRVGIRTEGNAAERGSLCRVIGRVDRGAYSERVVLRERLTDADAHATHRTVHENRVSIGQMRPNSLRATCKRSRFVAVIGRSGSRISSLTNPRSASAAFTGIGLVSQNIA